MLNREEKKKTKNPPDDFCFTAYAKERSLPVPWRLLVTSCCPLFCCLWCESHVFNGKEPGWFSSSRDGEMSWAKALQTQGERRCRCAAPSQSCACPSRGSARKYCPALLCFPTHSGPDAVRMNTWSKLCRASREELQARRFTPFCLPEEVICCCSGLPVPLKSSPKPARKAVCSNRPVSNVGGTHSFQTMRFSGKQK